ncbi:MAG: MBL fold metallo-hydrolase, partial [Acidiferrobacterales bacterium]
MSAAGAVTCDSDGVWVQVIGASKPASSGYILWINGKARALIDAGSSSAINFNNSKARVADLDLVLFTHLHVNHTADLATLVQSSLAEGRASPLPIYGPARSKLMPSMVTFVRTLFDKKRGLYRYLGELVSPFGKRTYKLQPHNIRIKGDNTVDVYANERLRVSAATIMHRPLPSLAWRLEVGGKTLVFSSDLDSEVNGLQTLARNADLLVVHNPS